MNKMDLSKILDEKNKEIIKISDIDGNVVKFEQIALINYEDELYTILHPIENDVDEDEVMVFKIVLDDGDGELIFVNDESLCNVIFDEYYKMLKKKTK